MTETKNYIDLHTKTMIILVLENLILMSPDKVNNFYLLYSLNASSQNTIKKTIIIKIKMFYDK